MVANASESPAPPAPPTVTPEVRSDGTGWWRHVWKIAAGTVLALSVFALLVALSLAQFASSDTSHKILRRAVAILTEIDPFLADNESELHTLAAQAPEEGISLPDYPVQVTLTAAEASLPEQELRELLLDRSAARIYEQGMSAFEEEGRAADIGVFSSAGAVKYSLGMLEDDTYDSLRLVVGGLAGLALLLAIALVLLTRGYGRLAALGAAVSLGALPFLVLAVTARFVLRLASEGEGDYLVVQLLELGKDMAWLPIRNGIAFSGLGLAFLIVGASVAWWTDLQLAARGRAFQ
jgi:hypothetical protein